MKKTVQTVNKRDPLLLEGEKVVETVRPHVLAFCQTYIIWVFFGLVSLGILIFGSFVRDFFSPYDLGKPVRLLDSALSTFSMGKWDIDMAGIVGKLEEFVLLTAWWYFLVSYASVVSFVRVNMNWLLGFIVIGLWGTVIAVLFGDPGLSLIFAVIVSSSALVFTEMYRRTHKVVITNFRLLMQAGLIKQQERSLFFSRLSDLALEQGLLGRIFDFGTLVPISQSGLGLGDDMTGLAAGLTKDQFGVGLAGGKMVSVPRGKSAHTLFGIPEPRRIHYLLEQLIHYNEDVTHLREIEKKLDKVKFLSNDEQGAKE